MTDIVVERIMDNLNVLSQFGAAPAGGVDRTMYSESYRDAVDWLCERCRDAGMRVREDAAGNVIARIGPEDAPAVVAGSHIDSVPGGGIYDGALGVLAGVECARLLSERGEALPLAFEVVAFADEEGAFISLLGSRAMTGRLAADEIEAACGRDSQPLPEAMRRYGLVPGDVGQAARPAGDVAAYVELHVEQGPVLESAGHGIGIVTGIVGLHTSEVVFQGEANHAGTTPLDLRRDAMRAAAATITECFAAIEREFPPDARLTYGDISIAPGASNVVPGEAHLIQEIRAIHKEDIERAYAMVRDTAVRVAAERGVEASTALRSFNTPVAMSEHVAATIEGVCTDLQIEPHRMPSGAGHDAQMMAARWPSGMIFVPSRGGISHNAAEETGVAEIELGARVLFRVLDRLLQRGMP